MRRRRQLRFRRRGPAGLTFGARRRSHRIRASLGVVALVAVASLASHAGGGSVPPAVEQTARDLSGQGRELGVTSGSEVQLGDGGPRGVPELPEGSDLAPSRLIGQVAGLAVHLPTDDPVVVGFHEAATAGAVALRPVGELEDDRNTTRTRLPADDPAGGRYLVLSSRGRVAGPTSAIDVVMREDDPVLASVTGTVVDVRSYLLYGAHQDLRIEIVPAARPDLRVVAIHVADAQVAVGDTVVGGVTPIASSVRRFPFGSQIDRETEPERFGHVHLEVQPVTATRPGDEVAGGTGADAGS